MKLVSKRRRKGSQIADESTIIRVYTLKATSPIYRSGRVHCSVCHYESAGTQKGIYCVECEGVLTWFRNRLNQGADDRRDVTFESSFSGDLAVDSLDLVEIIIDLEDDYDVAITGDNALSIDTVGDAVSCVRQFRPEVRPLQIAIIQPGKGSAVAHDSSLAGKLSTFFTKVRRPR